MEVEEDMSESIQNFEGPPSELNLTQFDCKDITSQQNEDKLQFAKTSKDRPAVITNGFVYGLKLKKKLKMSKNWKDRYRKCNGKVSTSLDKKVTLHQNHCSDESKDQTHMQHHSSEIEDEKDIPEKVLNSNSLSSELIPSQFEYKDLTKEQYGDKIRFAETSKCRPALIMEGFMYSLKKKSKTSKNWHCTNKKCKGKVTTSLDGKVILHSDTRHNHYWDESKFQNHLLRQACKRKAEEDLSERPGKIIKREASLLDTGKVTPVGVQSSRRAIWMQRRKALRNLPLIRKAVSTSLDEKVTLQADTRLNLCNDLSKDQAHMQEHSSQIEDGEEIPRILQNFYCQSFERNTSQFVCKDIRKQQNKDKMQLVDTSKNRLVLSTDGLVYKKKKVKKEIKLSKIWKETIKKCNGKLTYLDEKVSHHFDTRHTYCNDQSEDQPHTQQLASQIEGEGVIPKKLQTSNCQFSTLKSSHFDYKDIGKQQDGDTRIQFAETSKGKPALIMEGFMYSLKITTKTSKNWQCTNKRCRGKVTTSLDGKVILHADTFHNHDHRDESKFQYHLLRQACKRKAAEDLSERPGKIIMREASLLDTDMVTPVGVQSTRRAIWLQRRKKRTKLPSNHKEAATYLDEKMTLHVDSCENNGNDPSKNQSHIQRHASQIKGEEDMHERLQNSNCQLPELNSSQFDCKDIGKQQTGDKIQFLKTGKSRPTLILDDSHDSVFTKTLKKTKSSENWKDTSNKCNGKLTTSCDEKVTFNSNTAHKPCDNNQSKNQAHLQQQSSRCKSEDDIPEKLQNLCSLSSQFDDKDDRKQQDDNRIQFAETSKGKPALIMGGFMYSLKKISNTSKNWQCTNKMCRGKVTTSLDGKKILHSDTRHNHYWDESKFQNHLLRQACKKKAAEDLFERPNKIIMREASLLNTDMVTALGVQSSRRAIWVQRRKVLPKLPSNSEELSLYVTMPQLTIATTAT